MHIEAEIAHHISLLLLGPHSGTKYYTSLLVINCKFLLFILYIRCACTYVKYATSDAFYIGYTNDLLDNYHIWKAYPSSYAIRSEWLNELFSMIKPIPKQIYISRTHLLGRYFHVILFQYVKMHYWLVLYVSGKSYMYR